MSPSPTFFVPSQVLTIEQATSRVQELINTYRHDEENVPSWTLPAKERPQFHAAFDNLMRYAMIIERFLIKLYMLFPDDVVRAVIAIVVCTHRQRDLIIAAPPNSSSAQYIMTSFTVRFVTEYLQTLFKDIWLISQWIASDDGKQHRYIVNQAVAEMRTSLHSFVQQESAHADCDAHHAFDTLHRARTSRSSSSSQEESDEGNSLWDSFDLSAADDLRVLLTNFAPLNIVGEELIDRRAFYDPEMWRRNYSRDRPSSISLRKFLFKADALAYTLYAAPERPSSPTQRSEDQVSEPVHSDESYTIADTDLSSVTLESLDSPSESGSGSLCLSSTKKRRYEGEHRTSCVSDEYADSDIELPVPVPHKRMRHGVHRMRNTTFTSRGPRRQVPATSTRQSCASRSRCSHNIEIDLDSGFEDQSCLSTPELSAASSDQSDCGDAHSDVSAMRLDPDDQSPTCEAQPERSKQSNWLGTLLKLFRRRR